MVRSVSGTSRIVVPVSSRRPNSAPMNNSGAQIHGVNPSESGPPIAKPMNPAACARPSRGVRRTGPQMPQAQRRQGDHRRPEHQPRPGVRIRLGAHQQHRDRGGDHWQRHHRRPDEDPHHRVDPGADRAGRVEPGTGGDHDGHAQQGQGNTVAAVARVDLAGPAHRPCGATSSLGQHQPRRAHCPSAGQPGAGHQRMVATPRRGGAAAVGGLCGAPAPTGNHRAKRPLTCSFGSRNGRQSC